MRDPLKCVAAMELPSQSSCRRGRIHSRITLNLQNGEKKYGVEEVI